MTNKSIDVTRLVAELKRRFGSARNLCRVLGVDENLLRPDKLALDTRGNGFARDSQENLNGGSAPTENAAQQLRLAIEEVLRDCEGGAGEGDVKRIIALLEKHAPLGAGDEVDRGAEGEELRRREEMPPALDAGELARVLREYGVNADEESVKRALDDMPMNALGGSLGGKFAEKRAGAAMDSASRKFGLGRIEAWGAADHAVDRRPVLSRQGMDKLSKKFPGVENVIV